MFSYNTTKNENNCLSLCSNFSQGHLIIHSLRAHYITRLKSFPGNYILSVNIMFCQQSDLDVTHDMQNNCIICFFCSRIVV